MRQLLTTALFIFSIFIFTNNAISQTSEYQLRILSSTPLNWQELEKTYPSLDSLKNKLAQQILLLQDEGFLAASVDSLTYQGNLVNAHLYTGKQYQLKTLNKENIETSINIPTNDVSWNKVQQIKQNLLTEYNEEGYLKAKVWLDDFQFNKNEVSATLYANKGQQYVFDSLIIRGNVEINRNYLNNYFSLKKGQAIQPKWLQKIDQRAQQSTFFELNNKPGFFLNQNGQANLVLDLKEKNSNEFDLILGFLPNPNPQLTSRNLLLTGEGSLKLYNPLGGGKTLALDYKQLQPESPRIDLDFVWPTLLDEPLGLTGNFQLVKQDSTFVNVNFDVGAQYTLGGNNYLRFFFKRTNSFLQEVDTAFIRQNRSLEQAVDYNQNLYGIKFNWDRRNNIVNPQNGYFVNFSSAIGNRVIEENNTITNIEDPNFDFSTIYAGLNQRQLSLDAALHVQYFIPLKQRSTILIQNKTGFREFENFFGNDLYRLGGLFSIRGVDEQSVLASKHSTTTLEYRFLLGKESFISAFADGAWVTDERTNINQSNFYTGLGSGIDLATQAGIFTLNLAVARDENTAFNFNRSRIHIGYVNRF